MDTLVAANSCIFKRQINMLRNQSLQLIISSIEKLKGKGSDMTFKHCRVFLVSVTSFLIGVESGNNK